MPFRNYSLTKNGQLTIGQIRSPNYDPLANTGWTINKDGSATFFSISLPGFAAGVKATFSATAPPSPNTGDLWYNTSDGLILSQWDGSSWVPFQIGTGAIASQAITPTLQAAGDTTNPNPFFSGGDTSSWTAFNGAVLTAVATTGLAYPFAGQVTTAAGQSFPVAGGPSFPCSPGDPVQVNGWLNSNCGASIAISFFDSGGTFLGDIETDIPSTAGAWQYVSCVGTVPAGAVSAGLAWGMTVDPTSGTEVVLGTGMTVLTKVFGGLLVPGTLTPVLFYDPGTGDLIASVADQAGTDAGGNPYVTGIASYNGGLTVQLSDGTAFFYPFTGTPHTGGQIFAGSTGTLILNSPTETNTDSQTQVTLSSKTAIGSSTPSGAMQVSDPIDGQVYNTQVRTLFQAADSATLTSLTTLYSSTVGARKYRIHGQLFISATANAQFTSEITLPAGASGKYSAVICRATTFLGQVTGGPNASNGVAVNLATATYSVVIDGLLTVTASGTLHFQAGSLTATGLVVQQSSFIDLIPV